MENCLTIMFVLPAMPHIHGEKSLAPLVFENRRPKTDL